MAVCLGCSSTECNCALQVVDSGTVDLTLAGSGSAGDPWMLMAETIVQDLATYSSTGVLTVGPGELRFRFPFAATLIGTTAAVNTAPTGADIILDVNKNGSTIYTTAANRPRIVAGTFATTTEPTPDVTTIVAGDYLQVDIDQVGSGVAGEDLTVFVRYSRP